jgi:hypothetical protein
MKAALTSVASTTLTHTLMALLPAPSNRCLGPIRTISGKSLVVDPREAEIGIPTSYSGGRKASSPKKSARALLVARSRSTVTGVRPQALNMADGSDSARRRLSDVWVDCDAADQ